MNITCRMVQPEPLHQITLTLDAREMDAVKYLLQLGKTQVAKDLPAAQLADKLIPFFTLL